MTEDAQPAAFDEWAIVELMGHVRMAGRVRQVQLFGSTLGQIDLPNGDTFVTQYFGGGSIYRLTPCDEETARQVAKYAGPPAIYRLELSPAQGGGDDDDDDDDVEHDDDWAGLTT